METLILILADPVAQGLKRAADDLGTKPDQLAIGVLTEFIAGASNSASVLSKDGQVLPGNEGSQPPNIAKHFREYPPLSIDLTQRVIDYACSLPNVSATVVGHSVVFRPRFARVEYVISFRGKPGGLVVSLYGTPKVFDAPPGFLRPDRRSYSRARLQSEQDVATFLPLLRRAYELRYGQQAPEDS